MKVLHVINSLAAGGAEKLVSELSSAQAEQCEVGLFTFFSDNDIFQDKLSSKVFFKPCYGGRYFSIKKIRILASLIKKYDIIHAHLFPALYVVAFLSFFYPKKTYILTEHNTVNRRRKLWLFLPEKLVYSRFSKIICISEGVKEALRKWMGKTADTYIIKNFVNLKAIKNAKKADSKELQVSGKRLLVMVGSFSAQKDQATLIEALSVLDHKYSLLLIGDGQERKRLEQLVKNRNVQDRVHFLGIRKNVVPFLKMCDYGILSSHWEGFGIVALEYMASGIVALGSNVDGLNEVIKVKKNLFNPGDYKSLASRIETIENDESLKQHILDEQSKIINAFDIEQSVADHFKLYKSVMK